MEIENRPMVSKKEGVQGGKNRKLGLANVNYYIRKV